MEINKEVMEHLQKHIVYPTTKKEIIEACNMMSDVSKEDKERFERNLPDWNYRNSDEVIRAVELREHLGHVSYPTNKKELLKACNKMTDVPKSYREWFERNLPERTYLSVDEILGTFKGVMHIREHVSYPATKSLILQTCKGMNEVSNKELWERCLPERTFNNSDDVIKSCRI